VPRYLLRLLMFSFILGAIPVILIGLISYYMTSVDIKNNVSHSNAQILQQTQIRVEQVMKTLELSVIQYANSSVVKESITERLSADDFGQIRDLSLGLYNLQTFISVDQAYLINPQKDWMIGFSQFRSFRDHPDANRILDYAVHPQSLFWETNPFPIRTVPSGSDMIIESENERQMMRLICKIPVYRTTFEPMELLIAEIPYDELTSLLRRSDPQDTTYIVKRDGTDFLGLSDTAYPVLAKHVSEHVQMTERMEGLLNTQSITGEPILVNYRTSEYNDWIYFSVVPIAQVTEQSRNIALITLLICVGIFIIVFAIAWYGSRRMYSPIRRLFEFTQEIGAGHHDDHRKDELGFIEEQLRSLDSIGKQLKEQIRGQFDHLKEFFVLKLFTGQISERDFLYRTSVYGFPKEWRGLAVIAVQIDPLHPTRYREQDKELLLFAINNIVGELLPPNCRFSPILMDQSQVTLLAGDYDDPLHMKRWLYEVAETIRRKVNEYLQLPISIGISRTFHQISEAGRAYGECLEALRCRIGLGPELLLHYDDINPHQESTSAVFSQLKLLEDQMIQALKLADSDRVHRLFKEYMQAVIDKEIPSNELPMLMFQLIVRAFQLFHEQGIPVRKVLGEQATVEYFLKLNSLEEIIRWFEDRLFAPIVAYMQEQSESQYVNIANLMVKLVHDSYDKDLSLDYCAEMLNFHPSYLSRVFKKETGGNFIDYVAEYRMNIAKHWLQNTSLRVSDIAEKVNYTNTTAFIRTFRKVVGMTPGQYRDTQGKE
jgi:two-component system, response regulator YesN